MGWSHGVELNNEVELCITLARCDVKEWEAKRGDETHGMKPLLLLAEACRA